jgi:flagella basal body P-ring formation protein FlgA
MISSADLLLLLAVALPGTAAVTPALEERVAARIAAVWGVPAAALGLWWGAFPGRGAPSADDSVRVCGNGADGWFVVELGAGRRAVRVRAGLEDTVVVAARPLASGARLEAGDLVSAVRMHWGPPAPRAARPGEGWEVRRPLAAGEVAARPAVAPPPLVAAGEPVRMVWRQGGVNIVLEGIALNGARRDQVVRARIQGRSGRLAGRAIAPGVVELGTGGIR